MGGFIMSEQKKQYTNEEYLKIKEYLEKNYPPLEEDREEDELMQKMDELEEKGFNFNNQGATMSVMTSLPATERVLVTINEMAKIIGMGHNSIRRLVRKNPDAAYVHRVRSRVYIKREMFIDIVLKQTEL